MAGRHSKFNSALQEKMVTLYSEGKTDKEVARLVGVSVRTIQNWKAGNSAFLHSIRDAKAVADQYVVESLFRLAVGYSYKVEKVFSNRGKIIRAETVEHCPPNVLACIYWLRNRQSDDWK